MAIKWQYYMFKFVSRLVTLLPYKLVLALGRLLGFFYYHAAARQRNRALKQIQEHMNIPLAEAEKIIRSSFIKIAQTFLEVLYMPVLTSKNIEHYVTIENKQYLQEIMAEGKGIIALAAHMGNWEWQGAALALNRFPVASIIKPQPNAQQTELINEYRRKSGIEIFTRGTEVVGVAKALKKGKIVGFFSDQDAGRHGIFVKFFAKMAATPQGAAVFAKKMKLPVVPMFIVRRPEGGHRLILHPPVYYKDTGNDERDMRSFIAGMTKLIENMIRQYPDEWIWFLKRWNTEYVELSERVGEQGE